MADWVLLLPPAEGKSKGGWHLVPPESPFLGQIPALKPARELLYGHLIRFLEAGTGLDQLLGVKGKHLLDAVTSNIQLESAPVMPAVDRYGAGVMYRALQFPDLPPLAQERLLFQTFIFSGLFGLLRPDDLIPLYKLKADATLPPLGKVSSYWRPILSPILNTACAGKTVWNLLPQAYAATWEPDGHAKTVVEVDFLQFKNGIPKTVSHGVKPLRGALIQFLATRNVHDPAQLAEWDAPNGFVMHELHMENKRTRVTFLKG